MVYYGQFNESGEPHGQGTWFDSSGNIVFKGLWSDSKKMNGYAILQYNDGSVKFEGHFENGMAHGRGTFYPQNSYCLKVECEFEQGRPSTYGTYYYKDNVKYVGSVSQSEKKMTFDNYKNFTFENRRCGLGKLFVNDVVMVEGTFTPGEKCIENVDGTFYFLDSIATEKFVGKFVLKSFKLFANTGSLVNKDGSVIVWKVFNENSEGSEGSEFYPDGRLKYKGTTSISIADNTKYYNTYKSYYNNGTLYEYDPEYTIEKIYKNSVLVDTIKIINQRVPEKAKVGSKRKRVCSEDSRLDEDEEVMAVEGHLIECRVSEGQNVDVAEGYA